MAAGSNTIRYTGLEVMTRLRCALVEALRAHWIAFLDGTPIRIVSPRDGT